MAAATEGAEAFGTGKMTKAVELLIAESKKAISKLWLGKGVELLTQNKGFAIVTRKRSGERVGLNHLAGKAFKVTTEQVST